MERGRWGVRAKASDTPSPLRLSAFLAKSRASPARGEDGSGSTEFLTPRHNLIALLFGFIVDHIGRKAGAEHLDAEWFFIAANDVG